MTSDAFIFQDDWDASSDEDKPTPVAPVAAPKKKGTLKAAIAAKEAEKVRRIAEGESEEESVVDELEQRRRDKQREIETDLLNASSLLAGSSIGTVSASHWKAVPRSDFH
jgi:translation initiation factor 3 subunit J